MNNSDCNRVEKATSFIQKVEEESDNIDQVNPSKINAQLFPDQEQIIDITIDVPKSFPLDVYLLMDVSTSMIDDLSSVVKISNQLRTYFILLIIQSMTSLNS